MKDIKIRWSLGKWYIGILLGVCMLCMISNVAKAQAVLSLDSEISGAEQVLLKWESDNENSIYQLQRAMHVGETYSVLTSVSGKRGTVTFYDSNVSLGKTYYYKVVKFEGEQVLEESAVLPVKITLAVPSKVKVKKQSGLKVDISWNNVEKATGYEIYRSTNKKKNFKKIASVKGNKYTDSSVESGKAYYYKVCAVKKKQKSLTSKKSSVAVVYMNPTAPVVTGAYTKKKVKITWGKVKGASSYYVYKKDSKGKYTKVRETKKLYYTDSNIVKDKSYSYKVRAVYQKDGKVIKSKNSKICKVLAAPVDPNKKMVALTFDDGPGRYTKDIVNCLKKNNAKATFFVIGSQVDAYKSSVKAASEIGCEIGNHTYTHPDLTRLNEAEIKSQISKTDEKIKSAIGKSATLMRTPGGSFNGTVEQAVGKPIILWSIDTRDWETRSCEKTVNAVMRNVKDGDIVLMHDIYGSTKDAACILIVKLRQQGYQLVTVSELAKYRGYTLKKGNIYYSLRRK